MISLKGKSVQINRVSTTRSVGNEEGMCVSRGVTVLGNWISMYGISGL